MNNEILSVLIVSQPLLLPWVYCLFIQYWTVFFKDMTYEKLSSGCEKSDFQEAKCLSCFSKHFSPSHAGNTLSPSLMDPVCVAILSHIVGPCDTFCILKILSPLGFWGLSPHFLLISDPPFSDSYSSSPGIFEGLSQAPFSALCPHSFMVILLILLVLLLTATSFLSS